MFLNSHIPNPIAFSIGMFDIYWYGLFLVIAILIGYWMAGNLARMRNMSEQIISSIYLNALISGLIGARIYHVIFDWTFYAKNPSQILAVWNGGLAIHGAIIGAILCVLYFSRKHSDQSQTGPYFWKIADLFVVPAILGQAIGRWGNYFNQELFGAPTDAWYGIPIDIAHRPQEFIQSARFHPAFLYESVLCVLVFVVLLCVFKKQKRPDGLVFWLYLGLYSSVRIIVESIRINDAAMIAGIRLPLVISLLLATLSIIIILKSFFNRKHFSMARDDIIS
ncbi:prolipoprotein diacylglyceryl transferase [Patescibacteria group bacterium]|nr:prolipoprotein diacylglyceryl transferase [Patescibacteria group bacterium]